MPKPTTSQQLVPLAAAAALLIAGLFTTVFANPGSALAAGPESFAGLAQKQGPAVVNIYTTQTVKAHSSQQFMFPDMDELPEPFRRFFGQPQQPHGNQPPPTFKKTSLGSGVITSADGYILTNNHVVQDAEAISVTLATYEEYEAKIIGRDPKTDLALIKIDPKADLPFVTFGDSDKLQVGDWVVAIGNPFGLEQTVTAGIVSAKGRSISNETYGNFIQTDASINPGNSGGALFNLQGEMVGVNTAIYSRGGGNIGIGFAIPVNMAKNILAQLKKDGKVVRGWLGVMIQQVSPDLAKNFGLERPIGALVGEVVKDSPAEKAGLRQGDVVIRYRGKEVAQMTMLPAMVAQTPVGEKVELVIIRDSKEKTIKVTIGKLEEDETQLAQGAENHGRELGLTVQEITPKLAESLDLEDGKGIIITNVEPGSAAAEAELKRGDLIMEVNRKPVANLKQYNQGLKNIKKDSTVLFLIKRDNHTRFVVLKKD